MTAVFHLFCSSSEVVRVRFLSIYQGLVFMGNGAFFCLPFVFPPIFSRFSCTLLPPPPYKFENVHPTFPHREIGFMLDLENIYP